MKAELPTRIFEPRRGRRTIERRAWGYLDRCQRALSLSRLPLPIPIDEWIESPLALRFGFADLSYLGADVLGAAFTEDGEILIDERVLKHEGRFRFTCAHELGHIALHRGVRGVFHDHAFDANLDSPDRYEQQADRFAAAFLMPLPLLERELVRVLQRHSLKLVKATMELMETTPESEWLWRKVILPYVTRRFGVSLAAAVYRFTDIRPKVEGADSLLPRELVNVLLSAARVDSAMDSTFIEDGIAVCRPLFSEK